MSKVVRGFLKPNYEGHKPQHPVGGVKEEEEEKKSICWPMLLQGAWVKKVTFIHLKHVLTWDRRPYLVVSLPSIDF